MSEKQSEKALRPSKSFEFQPKTEGHDNQTFAVGTDPLTQFVRRQGAAEAHAAILKRSFAQSSPGRGPQAAGYLLALQRQYGNRYVQRVVAMANRESGEGAVAPSVESAIESARGGGQPMETGTRLQMESAIGADFTGVRIHQDARAHSLNQAVNAIAFTTGKDIFFRDGSYNPSSRDGRHLLAHELTHVVQQNGDAVISPQHAGIQRMCSECMEEERERGVQPKLAINQPDDQYEQEA